MFIKNKIVTLLNLFRTAIWRIHTKEKIIYLTFDDGPIPEITPFVLDTLKNYDAKATFFCIGENVKDNPTIFQRIIQDNHALGNHTYSHIKGWTLNTAAYCQDVENCAALMKADLFRPPYGSATPSQIHALTKNYKIVMWDITSGDFDINISKETCLNNVLSYTRNGSIVLFHDNLKSAERMMYALPLVLAHFSAKGYRFETLKSDMIKSSWLIKFIFWIKFIKFPLFKLKTLLSS